MRHLITCLYESTGMGPTQPTCVMLVGVPLLCMYPPRLDLFSRCPACGALQAWGWET
jgi:hypothetical protein